MVAKHFIQNPLQTSAILNAILRKKLYALIAFLRCLWWSSSVVTFEIKAFVENFTIYSLIFCKYEAAI